MSAALQMAYTSGVMCLVVKMATVTYSSVPPFSPPGFFSSYARSRGGADRERRHAVNGPSGPPVIALEEYE